MQTTLHLSAAKTADISARVDIVPCSDGPIWNEWDSAIYIALSGNPSLRPEFRSINTLQPKTYKHDNFRPKKPLVHLLSFI